MLNKVETFLSDIVLDDAQYFGPDPSVKAKLIKGKALALLLELKSVPASKAETYPAELIVDGFKVPFKVYRKANQFCREGNKLQAIKEIREAVGSGLIPARDFVVANCDSHTKVVIYTTDSFVGSIQASVSEDFLACLKRLVVANRTEARESLMEVTKWNCDSANRYLNLHYPEVQRQRRSTRF